VNREIKETREKVNREIGETRKKRNREIKEIGEICLGEIRSSLRISPISLLFPLLPDRLVVYSDLADLADLPVVYSP
jgi:hypothetical protein